MPATFSFQCGDPGGTIMLQGSIELPDAGGGSVLVSGTVTPVGGASVAITGSPLTMPTIPGSGTTYWSIEVNTTTGASQIIQSSSGYPAPDAGNVVIFSQALAAGAPADVANDGAVLPNDS